MQPKRNFPDNAKLVFEGVLFDVYQWQQELFDGTTTTFEGLSRADSVDILLVDGEGRIGINHQSQPGKKEFLACYGGRVEMGEDALEGAKRELLEESGYIAREWETIVSYGGSGKQLNEVTFFVARGIERIAEQSLDGGEIISEAWVSFDEFVELLVSERLRTDARFALLFARARIDGTMDDLRRRILGR